MGKSNWKKLDTFPDRLPRPELTKKPCHVLVQFMGDWHDRRAPHKLKAQALHFMYRAPHHQYVFLSKQPDAVRIGDCYQYPDRSWVGLSIACNPEPRLSHSLALEKIDARGHMPWLSMEPIMYRVPDLSLWETHVPWEKLGWMVIGPLTGAHAKVHYERIHFDVGEQIGELTELALGKGVPVCHKDACGRYYGGTILKQMPEWE
jgi:protein gp37